MLIHLRPAIALTVVFTLLTGLAYPLVMTGAAQTLFPAAANGSLIETEDTVIGSSLIAQPFVGAGYLHPRPSTRLPPPAPALTRTSARKTRSRRQAGLPPRGVSKRARSGR